MRAPHELERQGKPTGGQFHSKATSAIQAGSRVRESGGFRWWKDRWEVMKPRQNPGIMVFHQGDQVLAKPQARPRARSTSIGSRSAPLRINSRILGG